MSGATWTGTLPQFQPCCHVPGLPSAFHTSLPDGRDPYWVTKRWHSREPGACGAHVLLGRWPASLVSRGLPYPRLSRTSLAGLPSSPPLPWAGPPCLLPTFLPFPLKTGFQLPNFGAFLPQLRPRREAGSPPDRLARGHLP